MKHFTFCLLAAFALGMTGSASAQIKKGAKVYVCTGTNAKTYHLSRTCKMLTICKGEVKQIKMAEAIKKGRSLCKICKSKKN